MNGSCRAMSLEEGVLRVLYEAPASAYECAAGLLQYAYATEAVTEEIEELFIELALRGRIERVGNGTRFAITVTGSQRLADLVEAA